MLRRLSAAFVFTIMLGQARAQQASVDHVAIYVKDVQVSAAFYKDVFGMAELQVPFRGVTIPVKWMDMGHGVALHIVGGRQERVAQSKWEHLALACGNMDATIRRLNAKGIPWASMDGQKAPQVRPDGVRQIFVQDPDGYWIEVNDR